MKKRLRLFVMVLALVLVGVFAAKAEPALAASKISSVEDLLAMEANPTGDYYLAKDITVPANTCLFSGDTPFMGTLDGKGHKLKGYKSTESCAIFANAKLAIFKNIDVASVNINVNGSVAALVYNADSCDFKNITVSGKIVSSTSEPAVVGAIVAYGTGSMEKCKNSAKITVQGNGEKTVGGLAGDFDADVLKNCSNSGAVTVTTSTDAYTLAYGGDYMDIRLRVAGLVAEEVGKVTSCTNTGNVALNLRYNVNIPEASRPDGKMRIYVAGVCQYAEKITSSGNTGKVKVTSTNSAKIYGMSYIGGVTSYENGYAKHQTKCYNTGAVSFTGAFDGKVGTAGSVVCNIGGLFGWSVYGFSECYNKGKISASFLSGHTGVCNIGGLAGTGNSKIKNCYNAGNVVVTNKGNKKYAEFDVGGLAGASAVAGGNATCNYSTGTVKAAKDHRNRYYQGQLIGRWSGPFLADKSLIFDNYYTKSKKPYGAGDTGWKPYMPTAKKVSSITSGNCPKLSSKYWVYSAKHKRLILKNNKEK